MKHSNTLFIPTCQRCGHMETEVCWHKTYFFWDYYITELKIYHLSYNGNSLDAFKIADRCSLRDVYKHMNLVMALFTVSGSVPRGDSEFFLCSKLVTWLKTIIFNRLFMRRNLAYKFVVLGSLLFPQLLQKISSFCCGLKIVCCHGGLGNELVRV